MSEEDDLYPGYTVEYHVQITNGSGGAGTVSVTATPGDGGNEFEVLSVRVINGDVSTRVASALIRDSGGETLEELLNASVAAAKARGWPTVGIAGDDPEAAGPGKRMVSGAMDLIVAVAAVALSQDGTIALVLRVHGSMPTFVEAGASTPTITINSELPE